MRKRISLLLAVIMILSCFGSSTLAFGGTPDHVIINQVYGASDDGYASHSFIELYNPTSAAVNMQGWTVQYRSSENGENNLAWEKLELTGTIKSGGYYLVRCAAITSEKNKKIDIPTGDQEWNMTIHNKGISVALMSNSTLLTDDFSGNVSDSGFTKPEGFVDLAAVQGNDATLDQLPPAYEGEYASVQSKKKAIRRVDYADTDNNKNDFVAVDYSSAVDTALQPHSSAAGTPAAPTYTATETTDTKYEGMFNDTSDVTATLIARFNSGAQSADGGSSEIVYYSSYNQYAYAVNGVKGVIDAIPMTNLKVTDSVENLTGSEINVASLVAGADSSFTYGDMTSVTVSADGKVMAIALQDSDYTKTGRVALFDCKSDGSLDYKRMVTVGVQPDMVTYSADGAYLLTANEGEPRMGYTTGGAVDPKGSVSIIDNNSFDVTTVDFTAFDEDSARSALVNKGIVLKKDTAPSVDLEPEYIAVSGNYAYVALQEANAIAVLDLTAKAFKDIYSVGFEDYSTVAVDIDKSDEKYAPSKYDNIKGIRMPDGISIVNLSGKTYLLTANEGDSRTWPADTETDSNEVKDKTSPVNKIKMNSKVTWFKASEYDGLQAGTDYLFGGRSFTMFEVTGSGLEEVYDSGDDFESITASKLPAYFNCSNDNTEVEDRSGKKGPEPETVITGAINGKTYAFVTLERIGGVMIYDITDPSKVTFSNYMNSRDYSADIKDDVSAEGLYFVSGAKSATGNPLLLAANEVSGTVSITELKSKITPKPSTGAGSGIVIYEPLTGDAIKVDKENYKKYITSKNFGLDVSLDRVNTKLTYESSDTDVATVSETGEVTVTGVGKAEITIIATDNLTQDKVTKAVSVTVIPTKSAYKLTSPAKGTIKVTVTKKASYSTGIQIKYGRNGSYKYWRTTLKNKTLKNLKRGKTYYIKIRSYTKLSDGTILYGNWTSYKKIRVK